MHWKKSFFVKIDFIKCKLNIHRRNKKKKNDNFTFSLIDRVQFDCLYVAYPSVSVGLKSRVHSHFEAFRFQTMFNSKHVASGFRFRFWPTSDPGFGFKFLLNEYFR